MSLKPKIEKECKKHGISIFAWRTKRYVCLKCISAAVTKRRKLMKEKALENKGGKCEYCGYSKCHEALEFHHLDPNQKDFTLSGGGQTLSWKRIQLELEKCILVCSNCHREIHAKMRVCNSEAE